MARTCGLIGTYNAGCRCPECRRAAREYRRRYRHAQRPQMPRTCPSCGATLYKLGGGHLDRCTVGR